MTRAADGVLRRAWARLRASDGWAGLVTGLVSSTFSTLFVQTGSRSIGRDPNVDWMVVGTVPLRGDALQSPPRRRGIAAGVASHQGADIMWAVVFFALVMPRIPRRLRRTAIATSAVPWAAATAAAEYFVFLPWVQPLLRMQVPYWTAAGVHTASSAAYPLFLWLRHGDRRAGRVTGAAMAVTLAGLAALRRAERRGRAPRRPGGSKEARDHDLHFLRRMSGHHVAGLELSELLAERGHGSDLRALGRLMAAEHRSEMDIMRSWYRSFAGTEMSPLTEEEREAMPSMPHPSEVRRLRGLSSDDFDREYVDVMVRHHQGGIRMAREEIEQGHDPRVRALAAAIDHAQTGQVAFMERHQPA